MPVYLLHGFRWPRPLIRIHIILQNLDDAAADWLVAPGTTETLLENFHQLYPKSMEHLPRLRFIEQFDSDHPSASSAQPHAYVADVVQEVKLGLDVDEIRGKGVPNDQWAALMELRDKLAPDETPGWYVVVCEDEERQVLPAPGPLDEHQHGRNGLPSRDSETETESAYRKQHYKKTSSPNREPRGFRKLFTSRLGRRRTRTRSELSDSHSSSPSAPSTDLTPSQRPTIKTA